MLADAYGLFNTNMIMFNKILMFLLNLFGKNNKEESKVEKEEELMGEYNGKVILLDCGHAKSTAGKRSPKRDDGTQFFEYVSNRQIGVLIAKKIKNLGVRYHYVMSLDEEKDKSLTARANTANAYASKYGAGNCLLISLHSNACGDGEEWVDKARGWSVYTTKGKTNSDKYATIFYEEALKLLPDFGMTLRKDTQDGDPDYEENFTVIYKTSCPAVLIEALFYTSRVDLEFLDSDLGREVLSDIIVNGIKRICFE